MEAVQTLGALMGLGFVAGINLYATVLAVGLGLRLGLIELAPGLEGLTVLAEPTVLIAAGLMYAVEFLADKIPWVDSAWDVLHTLIRPLGAVVIAATALGRVDPGLELAAVLLAGGVALSTHVGKAGLRLVVNASPEPLSNVGLSLVEDAVAIGGAWLALSHPAWAAAVVAVFVVAFVLVMPWFARLVRVNALAVRALLRRWAGTGPAADDLIDPMPGLALRGANGRPGPRDVFLVRCVSGRGLPVPVMRVGHLRLGEEGLSFITRRRLRLREYRIGLADLDEVRLRRGVLFDRLALREGRAQGTVLLFRDGDGRGERLAELLERARRDARTGPAPIAAGA